jgi:alanine racemase
VDDKMANDFFYISEIAKITKATVTSVGSDEVSDLGLGLGLGLSEVRHLLTDSRHLQSPDSTLFVALRTKKNDGHKYIADLYSKGVRYFLVEQTWDTSAVLQEVKRAGEDNMSAVRQEVAVFLKVNNTLKALQEIAAAHRKLFNIPVMAITGSNGKTIVKEWLSTLLQEDKKIVKSPKSYNSQIGVPLSVWEMKEDDEFAIFEAGISEPNEMDALQKIIKPTIGLFTNIGTAHDEYFLDKSQKTAEKLKLFTDVSLLIYPADYLEIREQMALSKKFKETKTLSWTTKKNIEADLKISEIKNIGSVSKIIASYNGKILEIEIPFTDKASVENAIQCWLFMLSEGYENEEIARRIKRLQPVEMRMELKEGINNCFIINDFYNFDYLSFVVAVDALASQNKNSFKRIIISDMLQSGREDEALYADIAQLLKQKKIDAIIGIGENISKQQKAFDGLQTKFFPDTESFLHEAKTEWFNNETILLKGARSFGFERISRFFQKKVHQTVFEINLSAIIHNLNVFRSFVKPSTKIMLMTKAFSYGTGSYEIAQMLHYHRADYLAVAYADEGVQLRENGVTIPIMVMNPEEQGLEAALLHNLEPEIYGLEMLAKLRKMLDNSAIPVPAMLRTAVETTPKKIKVHIKLNTGMNRLGFSEEEIPQLLQVLQSDKRIKVASVLTHLATADEIENDKYTLAQLEKFDRISSRIIEALPYNILRHCLNTAGITRFPQYQYDMVRLGIGLYGIDIMRLARTEASGVIPLENVGTLKTVISQIHTLQKDEAVGYGRRFIATKPTRIGVIGIGYADGYNRHLGNGVGEMLVHGKRVPTVGSICMDMCMIDLTSVSEAQVQDEVTVFGKDMPVTELAEKLDTIPYEILTGISTRVKRVYYQE